MMKIFKRNKVLAAAASLLVLLALFIIPVLSSSADTGLIQCGNDISVNNGVISGECTFNDFIATIQRIIDWIIGIAGVIFTISFVYGGFLYMTSGDNPGNKGKATGILWGTLKGFVIMLVAWVIVYTIVKTLAPDQSSVILKFLQ